MNIWKQRTSEGIYKNNTLLLNKVIEHLKEHEEK